jgi:hypothetical protein
MDLSAQFFLYSLGSIAYLVVSELVTATSLSFRCAGSWLRLRGWCILAGRWLCRHCHVFVLHLLTLGPKALRILLVPVAGLVLLLVALIVIRLVGLVVVRVGHFSNKFT